MSQTSTPPETFRLMAKTFFGLEDVLAAELTAMGAGQVQKGSRIVHFTADEATFYRICLSVRTALKILLPIASFTARDEHQLYEQVRQVNFEDYMELDNTFAVDSTVYSDYFRHSKYVALKVKDAIADQFRERHNSRPSVDTERPDIGWHISLLGDSATLSLDATGWPLYQRGYKTMSVPAPINEVLAAGLILLTGWKGEKDFYDPMCGSGTFLTEAALIAMNRSPQLNRTYFAFRQWPTFRPKLFEQVKEELIAAERPDFKFRIYGSDMHHRAVKAAQLHAKNAGVGGLVRVQVAPFDQVKPRGEAGLMIMNPPYGERLETEGEETALYRQIGDHLKANFQGFEAWLLTANSQALKAVGLATSARIKVFNGPLECRFCRYELYEGSKKRKWQQEQS